MSTISAIAHTIDQLLTQRKELLQENHELKLHLSRLQRELVQTQAPIKVQPDHEPNQQLEDKLNQLIDLFDQVTDIPHE